MVWLKTLHIHAHTSMLGSRYIKVMQEFMERCTFVLSLIISIMIMMFISCILCWWVYHFFMQNHAIYAYLSLSWPSRRYPNLVLDLNWKFFASSCCHFTILTEDILLDILNKRYIVNQAPIPIEIWSSLFETNWIRFLYSWCHLFWLS
jgi:hypothetical protein